jgi:hypothetical protein
MADRKTGNASLRLITQIGIAFVVWAGTVVFASRQLEHHEHGAVARALLVAIAVGGFLPWIYVIGKSILAQDEYTQRIHFVAIAVAFGGTALLSYACDFLEKAGFIPWSPFATAWMVMGVVWWLSIVATARYYR